MTSDEHEDFAPNSFDWRTEGTVAVISLRGADRKNPLTFESYAELRDCFRALHYADDIDVVVFASNGGNFCSGGDVHDIIGPLVEKDMKGLLAFTRMTGDLVKAMLSCGKPIIAAIDGICVGAGAIIAMASDIRLASPNAKDGVSLYARRPCRLRYGGVRDAATDHWPRTSGRAALFRTQYERRRRRAMGLLQPDCAGRESCKRCDLELAGSIASGPTFAHMMTKTMLAQEWNMSLEQAIEAEAQTQAICMQTQDFRRAYEAFVAKQKPVFQGD